MTNPTTAPIPLGRRIRTTMKTGLDDAIALAFVRHECDRQRPPARNGLHALLRDWDLAGFYLPVGWVLLALGRVLRPPPYGYRGVPRAQAVECQGGFLWHRRERPLPRRPHG